jgi:hypothetical protein
MKSTSEQTTKLPTLREALGGALYSHRFVATRAVSENLTVDQIHEYIDRHLESDWSEIEFDEDRKLNEAAIRASVSEGIRPRVMSVYRSPRMAHLTHETRVWVITDPEWQTTTVLFPSDY